MPEPEVADPAEDSDPVAKPEEVEETDREVADNDVDDDDEDFKASESSSYGSSV